MMSTLFGRILIAACVFALSVVPVMAHAADDDDDRSSNCPRVDRDASPVEVLNGRNAALKAGNLELAVCFYARDAVVLTPAGAFEGRPAIQAGLASLGTLFGGAFPEILSTTVSGDVMLVTFSITGPTVSVVNGADTYIVRRGLIRYQTAHDPLTFH